MGRMGSRMGGYVRAANMTKEQTQRGRPEGVTGPLGAQEGQTCRVTR